MSAASRRDGRISLLVLTDTAILGTGGSERFLRNLLAQLPSDRYADRRAATGAAAVGGVRASANSMRDRCSSPIGRSTRSTDGAACARGRRACRACTRRLRHRAVAARKIRPHQRAAAARPRAAPDFEPPRHGLPEERARARAVPAPQPSLRPHRGADHGILDALVADENADSRALPRHSERRRHAAFPARRMRSSARRCAPHSDSARTRLPDRLRGELLAGQAPRRSCSTHSRRCAAQIPQRAPAAGRRWSAARRNRRRRCARWRCRRLGALPRCARRCRTDPAGARPVRAGLEHRRHVERDPRGAGLRRLPVVATAVGGNSGSGRSKTNTGVLVAPLDPAAAFGAALMRPRRPIRDRRSGLRRSGAARASRREHSPTRWRRRTSAFTASLPMRADYEGPAPALQRRAVRRRVRRSSAWCRRCAGIGIGSTLLCLDNQYLARAAVAASARCAGRAGAADLPCRGRLDLATVRALRALLAASPTRSCTCTTTRARSTRGSPAARRALPIVATAHGHFADHAAPAAVPPARVVADAPLRAVCMVSDADAGAAAPPAGVRGERIRLIENGIDTARFSADAPPLARADFGIPDDAIVFGAAMRLTEQKNPLGLIDAFAQVLAADCRARCW